MSEESDRFRRLAAQFTERVAAVPPDRWDSPSPCEGWLARDVVGHLVEWLPAFFFERWGIGADVPPAASHPGAAWEAVHRALQDAFDDPAVADRIEDTPMGPMSFAQSMAMIGTPDVLIHTWDLARATGLDETLDADEVAAAVAGIDQIPPEVDAAMRGSGHFGPRVDVGPDASAQDRLLGFNGRQP